MPENTRKILICVVAIGLVVTSFIFDALYDEQYNHLRAFKFAYNLQENIPLKHGLTNRNHFKLSFLTKIIEIIVVKIYAPLIVCFV